jgi:pimeloyl-ACP methyl ester carboxylesterase
MPEVRARGIRFHVQTLDPPAGNTDAPVVVFVHGLILDDLASFYRSLALPVAAAGARVVLYDQRGHGLSERPPSGYGAAEAAADLFAVLDVLGHREPVYLVCNSYGGVPAFNAVMACPHRVAGMVVIDSYGPTEDEFVWNEEHLNTLARTALVLEYERRAEQYAAIGWRQGARQHAAADALLNGTTLIQDVAASRPALPADLAALTCPVLAIYGERSDLLEAGRSLDRHVPDCTLHVLEGMPHTLLLEAPHLLVDLMLPWLTEHAGLEAGLVR